VLAMSTEEVERCGRSKTCILGHPLGVFWEEDDSSGSPSSPPSGWLWRFPFHIHGTSSSKLLQCCLVSLCCQVCWVAQCFSSPLNFASPCTPLPGDVVLLVSRGCANKLSHIAGLNRQQFILTVLEIRHLQLRSEQGHFPATHFR
jgi:hypothetical protein